ncbi:MAG: NUDIX hydrolase [Vampirovibrio sp.]
MQDTYHKGDPQDQAEIQTHRQRLHQGHVIDVVQDQILTAYGKPAVRDVVLHPGGVCVLPVLPDGRLILVRQFRYATQEFLWEFPAGKLDVQSESHDDAIQRELWEETGYESTQWTSYGFIYTAPGFCNERIYLYKAEQCTLSPLKPPLIEDEALRIEAFTPEAFKQMIHAQEIKDAKTLALWAFL